MEKRSFALDENPHSGMLRLSLLQTILPKTETERTDVPHTRNGPHVLSHAVRDRVIVVFDNFECEPDSRGETHDALTGLFSAARETIWPMMTDRIHDTTGTASGTYRSCAREGRVLSRHRVDKASGTANGGKSYSDLYMGHGS
jgi:hypothetical protein